MNPSLNPNEEMDLIQIRKEILLSYRTNVRKNISKFQKELSCGKINTRMAVKRENHIVKLIAQFDEEFSICVQTYGSNFDNFQLWNDIYQSKWNEIRRIMCETVVTHLRSIADDKHGERIWIKSVPNKQSNLMEQLSHQNHEKIISTNQTNTSTTEINLRKTSKTYQATPQSQDVLPRPFYLNRYKSLSSFSGVFSEFPLFWKDFCFLVDDTKLYPSEKLYLLKKKLNKFNMQKFQNYQDYENVKKELKNYYLDSFKLKKFIFDQYRKVPSVMSKYDHSALNYLIDQTQIAYNALTHSGFEKYRMECCMNDLREQLLFKTPMNIFANYMDTKGLDIPRILDAIKRHLLIDKPDENFNNEHWLIQEMSKSRDNLDICHFCLSTLHITSKCTYTYISMERKSEIIKEKKLCGKCLIYGHPKYKCKTKIYCDNCTLAHPTALCNRRLKKKRRFREITIQSIECSTSTNDNDQQNSERILNKKSKTNHEPNTNSMMKNIQTNVQIITSNTYKKSIRKLIFMAQIKGKSFKCRIDSEVDINLLSKDIANYLNLYLEKLRFPLIITILNNTVKTYYKCSTIVKIGIIEKEIDFYVSSSVENQVTFSGQISKDFKLAFSNNEVFQNITLNKNQN